MSPRNRLSPFCLGTVLLSLCFVCSCKTCPPDAREELVRSLKGADVNGFLFATKEEDNQVITTLTNGALRNPVRLGGANSLVLGYAGVKDRKTNTTKTLKAEIVKADNGFKLRVTDLGTNNLEFDERYEPRPCGGDPVFNDLNECTDDFECKVFPELLCEANRTCKTRLFEVQCCLRDGSRFHVLTIIRPTRLRCLVAFPFDIDSVTVIP